MMTMMEEFVNLNFVRQKTLERTYRLNKKQSFFPLYTQQQHKIQKLENDRTLDREAIHNIVQIDVEV